MATDVDVQYFSHLNGLTLGNNWGDLIRLLDKTLVTGIDFTEITSASINEQGDVIINLFAAHNAMLFQIVELSGFSPASLNQKYRIKGVPSATQLILKPKNEISATAITTVGEGKLASLGYEIIFRDENDVKRVYRAKNPTAQHPFIRVDESLASDTGTYTATYAKYAMIGLLEHMDHIDDFENPDVLQLPFDPVDPAKNWRITGASTSVVRGWSRWYWARGALPYLGSADTDTPLNVTRKFTLVGDASAFYFLRQLHSTEGQKIISGAGLFNATQLSDVIPNWFLMTSLLDVPASTIINFVDRAGGNSLTTNTAASQFFVPAHNLLSRTVAHTIATPILYDMNTGFSDVFSGSAVGALETPFTTAGKVLRGSLQHIFYAGNKLNLEYTHPIISENSIYVWDSTMALSGVGGFYFYLGELE